MARWTRRCGSSPKISERAAGRLTLIGLPTNAGAVARNIGVNACTTTYVASCDDDSWWAPEAAALAEDILDAHLTVAVLAGRALRWPQRTDDPMNALLAATPLGRDPALPGPSILGFMACSAIVRKTAFEAVGGFSPILHFRGEEQLLAWDLAADGWDLCFCDTLLAFHRPSDIRPPADHERARELRNTLLTNCLRRPLPQCWCAAGVLARAAARDAAYRSACGEALVALPRVLRERHRLPNDVERSVRRLEDDRDGDGVMFDYPD